MASPSVKKPDLQPFNIEENGGAPYTPKAPGRHHHHQHHHHHHHYLPPYGVNSSDGNDIVSEGSSSSKVSLGVPIQFEDSLGHHKKGDTDTNKMALQWPPVHINISKGEEKKTLEKHIHPPLSPSSVPEHMKCNILTALPDPAFRMGPQATKEEPSPVDFCKSPTLQDANVRSPASLRAESTQSTGSSSSKQEVRPPRLKKLTRQFSFNHSDEDDLPPALAAVAAESAAEHRAALLQASNGHSQSSSVEKSPCKASSSFTLEPGDLLMDFTEATPMIKTYPADPCNSFFDPFTTVQQFPIDLLETPMQQYPASQPSPKRLSPSVHMMPGTRSTVNQAQTTQMSHSSHMPMVDRLALNIEMPMLVSHMPTSRRAAPSLPQTSDISEALRRELEREKMMKRLLMTEL